MDKTTLQHLVEQYLNGSYTLDNLHSNPLKKDIYFFLSNNKDRKEIVLYLEQIEEYVEAIAYDEAYIKACEEVGPNSLELSDLVEKHTEECKLLLMKEYTTE